MEKDKISGIVREHEFVDLGLPSGLKWATCNVGATKPEEYGDYFAWGETKPKDEYTEDNYVFYDWDEDEERYVVSYYDCFENELHLSDDAAHVNWGGVWRMPTLKECNELMENCEMTWVEYNGVVGAKFTGPSGNSIFFPAAGSREGNDPYEVGNRLYIPSTTVGDIDDDYYRCSGLYIEKDNICVDDQIARDLGMPVRPVAVI